MSGNKKQPPKAGQANKIKALDPSDIIVKKEGSALKSSSSRFLNVGPQEKLEPLPKIRSLTTNAEKEAMFIRKIRQCCVVFDFTDVINLAQAEQKEIKRETLLELVEFVLTDKLPFSPIMYKAVIAMVSTNLFRPLPPRLNPSGDQYDPEDNEPILEVAWPHVQIVYEFFLRFVESGQFDAGVAKQYLGRKFVQQMLDLFDSEDPRERDCLKTTLHRVYGKFLSLRSYIRKAIKLVFLSFCYESESHNGIAELLEILGSIINGFTLPLKDEHKEFLLRALVPLHKPRAISLYHPQLSYCIAQYIEKDPSLTEQTLKTLISLWPITNSSKQMLFLNEIEEILLVISQYPEQFIVVQEMVFKKIAECIASPHFQIAEKALTIWSCENNECILRLVAENVEVILPILFPSLFYVAKSHWHKAIRSMAYSGLRLFMDIDDAAFGVAIDNYQQHRKREKEERDDRVQKWKELFAEVEPQMLKEKAEEAAQLATRVLPTGPNNNINKPKRPLIHLDPLLGDNDGLPTTVVIPRHMGDLIEEEFTVDDPVFKELTEEHQIQMHKKLRHKQMLPMDPLTVEALQDHISLDDKGSYSDSYTSEESYSYSSRSSYSTSGSYSDDDQGSYSSSGSYTESGSGSYSDEDQ
eukprot:TRINITY_DN5853_c0_g1_i1.p1 TRINITY_DN5853_c0_g1~~TRINITY_DN5853_c0_g1_i1.p1  ORF type:complete len:638 (+),score=139.34 TRINITY_DN5853_c0_g1_i1:148-2061(+)